MLKNLILLLFSMKLSVVLLLLLLLLTWLGTLAQVELGLYQAQVMYFYSWFLLQPVGGVPLIPLRWTIGHDLTDHQSGTWRRLAFVAEIASSSPAHSHAWFINRPLFGGILFMLVAGGVTYRFSHEGGLLLYEGNHSDFFTDYHRWELLITRRDADGSERMWRAPQSHFSSERVDLPAAGLQLVFERASYHSALRRAPAENDEPVMNGIWLQPLTRPDDEEAAIPGMYLTVSNAAGEQLGYHWVFGLEQADLPGETLLPWTMRDGDVTYGIALRRIRHPLPFTIQLDDFTRELHAGTSMARAFRSDVSVEDAGQTSQVRIEMNQPLRRHGFTVFQAKYGPADAKPGDRLYSVPRDRE